MDPFDPSKWLGPASYVNTVLEPSEASMGTYLVIQVFGIVLVVVGDPWIMVAPSACSCTAALSRFATSAHSENQVDEFFMTSGRL
jgi:hypothetical protein